ncbi:uncharacterized protein LOC112518902 isoform X2 [Cynara cardunculus var. scolymus]|uniref:uncharacterized protein LOC112518902 isoform X2 n=1 Tax=Cynara cardunculus var. scolymus TaxID=59895 RepID=UPI000D62B7AA|nr:uncharacterized protein LOC112518902 isoform X2 [Cynara cardunculus var. scolymus]
MLEAPYANSSSAISWSTQGKGVSVHLLRCHRQKYHRQLFNEYLRKINMELSYVQFELRACRNQYDGGVYYGVINNVADEQSKLGTRYTVPQIAFYKGIIEAIVQDATAQGTISNIAALNVRLENQGASTQVPTAFRNFSMSQKEKSLQEFVQDQWLCTTPDGKIGLGVRSFLDLRSWFHNNEVPTCDVCNEAGIKADLCPNESCTVRIHDYCLKAKFSQSRIDKVCPGCGTQWPFMVAKAEAVEEEDADVHQPPLVRKRLRSSRIVEEDESQPPSEPLGRRNLRSSRDGQEDESNGPSQVQPSSGPSNRRARKIEDEESIGQRRKKVQTSNDGSGPSQETRRSTRTSSRLHR